jgi:hypothetical protein
MQSLEPKALAQTTRPQFKERQQSMAPFYRGHRLLMPTSWQGGRWKLGRVDDTYSRVVLLDDERAPDVTFMGATLMVLHS